MAEEQQGQEKTEEATPRKLEKAKEEGQVARSRELNSVAIVTFGAVAGLAFVPSIGQYLSALFTQVFSDAGDRYIDMTAYLGEVAVSAIWVVAPFVFVMFLAGIVSSLGVGGLVFSAKAFAPKASRMSIIKGLGRMFSMKALVELGKSIAKFLLVAGVAVAALNVLLSHLLNLGALPIESAIYESLYYVGFAVLVIGSSLIVVAAIDVPFQIAQHKKQLKMTKQEVKDELKDSDGKPEVKARVRALQQEIANRKMLEDVPEADVIITNPEHFSVAIRYNSDTMTAPLVVAMGVDHMAFKIREIGAEHEVQIVPVPPLARALYFNSKVGEEIPHGLYLAVAQVLAFVYQLEQYARGELAAQPTLADVKVPDEFSEEGEL